MPLQPHEYVSPAWRDDCFKNKVVFCTGGNGTICSIQVRALVHLGANACIVGRNVEKTEFMAKDIATARPGAKVLGYGNIDVRNIESLRGSVENCVRELGGIDLLIAGAAGNFLAPFAQLSPNAFKTVMEIDVLGSFNITKLCLPYLVESAKRHNSISTLPHSPTDHTRSPGGRIIYVSSTNHYTSVPLQTHVNVAKAGVDVLSACVALEYGPLGVTSNVIAPGPIAGTEGVERLSKKSTLESSSRGRGIPLQRYGTVKEIADATVYLFSDTGNYVTASTLVVDGGAWRTGIVRPGADFEYPEFLLSGAEVTNVAGKKKSGNKSKL